MKCPACDNKIEIPEGVEVGDIVECDICRENLEVIYSVKEASHEDSKVP